MFSHFLITNAYTQGMPHALLISGSVFSAFPLFGSGTSYYVSDRYSRVAEEIFNSPCNGVSWNDDRRATPSSRVIEMANSDVASDDPLRDFAKQINVD